MAGSLRPGRGRGEAAGATRRTRGAHGLPHPGKPVVARPPAPAGALPKLAGPDPSDRPDTTTVPVAPPAALPFTACPASPR